LGGQICDDERLICDKINGEKVMFFTGKKGSSSCRHGGEGDEGRVADYNLNITDRFPDEN
jgi:hypothetical protein